MITKVGDYAFINKAGELEELPASCMSKADEEDLKEIERDESLPDEREKQTKNKHL